MVSYQNKNIENLKLDSFDGDKLCFFNTSGKELILENISGKYLDLRESSIEKVNLINCKFKFILVNRFTGSEINASNTLIESVDKKEVYDKIGGSR